MRTGIIGALLLAGWCALAAAQGTVYESKDKSGPVFSDQPSPGAKPVDLGPANVIDTGPAPVPATAAAARAAYRSLAIAVPENGGTIHSNTGAFSVRAQVSPSLRTNRGDRIRVKLDGNLLPRTYASSRFNITATDWQGAATSDVQHSLQIAIVDGDGNVLIESAPISFFAHRASRLNRAR